MNWYDLLALGEGAVIGTGILTFIGVSADRASPAIIVSFVFAGIVCAYTALAYAEMASVHSEKPSDKILNYLVIAVSIFSLNTSF